MGQGGVWQILVRLSSIGTCYGSGDIQDDSCNNKSHTVDTDTLYDSGQKHQCVQTVEITVRDVTTAAGMRGCPPLLSQHSPAQAESGAHAYQPSGSESRYKRIKVQGLPLL